MVRESRNQEMNIKDRRTYKLTQIDKTQKDCQFRNKITSKFKIKIHLKVSIRLAETIHVNCLLLGLYKGLGIQLFQLFSRRLICGLAKWIHFFFTYNTQNVQEKETEWWLLSIYVHLNNRIRWDRKTLTHFMLSVIFKCKTWSLLKSKNFFF